MSSSRRTSFWEDEKGNRGRRGRESYSDRGKQHTPGGSWIPTVPTWEKRFCTAICRIPWMKICETKEILPFYPNVAEWDDSAAKEAFENAKAKFYAEINDLSYHVSSPGPDIYVDEINWNPEIDHSLVLELDLLKNGVHEIRGNAGSGRDLDDANRDPWERDALRMNKKMESGWQAPWRLEDCFLKVVDKSREVEEKKNLRDEVDDANMDPWERGVGRVEREMESEWHEPWRHQNCFSEVVGKTHEVIEKKTFRDHDDANMDPWGQGARWSDREMESKWHAPWRHDDCFPRFVAHEVEEKKNFRNHDGIDDDGANINPWERGVAHTEREIESQRLAPWRHEDCFTKTVDKTHEVGEDKILRNSCHYHRRKNHRKQRRHKNHPF